MTLGARLEHNDFSGWKFQPDVRLLWSPYAKHRLWAAVSRAVHTPSRFDNGGILSVVASPPQSPINLPSLVFFQGNSEFVPERLTAYELGYRTWPAEQLSLDIAMFYNDYDDLHALERRSDLVTLGDGYILIPDLFVNAVQSQTYGFELATNWQAMDGWRLQLAYSYLLMKFQNKPGYSEVIPVFQEGSQPHYQISLRSSFDIRHDLEFDLWLCYVDEIPELIVGTLAHTVAVDAYFSVNARIGWRPRHALELSLVGTNLLGPPHVEFVQETYSFPEQVERGIYGQIK